MKMARVKSEKLSMSDRLRSMRERGSPPADRLAAQEPAKGEIILSRRDLTTIDSTNAKLPATYANAKAAIAECESIDECKEWSNKMAALASYARQAHDDYMLNMAERIKARAMRRCGELLNELAPAGREAPRKTKGLTSGVRPDTTSKAKVAKAAGLSKRHKVTATRIARVPKAEFEAAVESINPPTVTAIAERGKQSKDVPKDFKVSSQAQGMLRRFAEFAAETDAAAVVHGAHDRDKDEITKNSVQIVKWIHQVCALLGRGNPTVIAEFKKVFRK